ncbi:ADP-ribosylglycohydrolase family protein [Diaphorobacter sp. HDW4B]|uniref:ADP-ribosylglycohydrolase family protein n=1 Tax=Diaphorobacter sp. HDW4B TaxID=2714925 RepID=UPI00140B0AE0|nr:ADP-ribosylglycohydrolase family protein [Diaphorobacter sp. HDW4B]QIL72696.1 ADP-ribosylglycohydrolase family protein [Diaphorobacter sp. HDW4B]
MTREIDRFHGALLGLACGDAVGTTVEFQPRGSFAPLTDIVGGGPFSLKAGQWTDDTSMALCLAESLIAKDGCDPHDQMTRYVNWYTWGYWSSTGTCFDIGVATREALERFKRTNEALAGTPDPRSAGNGSLMRLAPIAMRYAGDDEHLREMAALSSRTTHGAEECIEACQLFVVALSRALSGASKSEVLDLADQPLHSSKIRQIAQGGYLHKSREQIRGSGYVVESLEAALWCFARHDNFCDAVLEAANLGDDADTTAAITGQIAGAMWGEQGIPAEWLARLCMADDIRGLASQLWEANARGR